MLEDPTFADVPAMPFFPMTLVRTFGYGTARHAEAEHNVNDE